MTDIPLQQMVAQVKSRIFTEFLAWTFGIELGRAIQYGEIVLKFHGGRLQAVDIILKEKRDNLPPT